MTKKDGKEITAMGLFRSNLDYEIKTKEETLASQFEGLRREIDRGLEYLKTGHRVNSGGIALHRGIEIDHLCVVLNELYDTRIAFDAALRNDTENADLGLHRGDDKGDAK